MKSLSTLLSIYLSSRRRRSNFQMLAKLLALLLAIVLLYSVLFHWIMAHEGQDHSWLTGFYWTMVSMSTLGFGDVTFKSDLGRMFSVLVLVTGTLYMLVLLPFTFIQFFYAPWLEARDATRAPRALPPATKGHVLLTAAGPVDLAVIRRLDEFGTPYFVIVPELADALALYDKGFRVMVGPLDHPDTYRHARTDQAALVVATLSDTLNANIAMTVRESAPSVPIVAIAQAEASCDILEMAGCQKVLALADLLGETMARRVFGRNGRSHLIGEVEGLQIAEAAAAHTSLVGHKLKDLNHLRERLNVTVGGVWDRGRYTPAGPDTVITKDSVLLLAGTRDELDAYDREFGREGVAPTHVLIIGGGRVGRAVARTLAKLSVDYDIVEKRADRSEDDPHVIVGDAANQDVLRRAGIDRASTVVVTTHDDDMNVYLTLFCRRLRPDVLILSRATLERNAVTLHRAGADFVLSYSAMGANEIVNMLRDRRILLVAEGIDVFTAPIPAKLAGRTLATSGLRAATGTNLLAIRHQGELVINPPPGATLPAGGQMILIGDRRSEQRFFELYKT